MGHSRNNYRRQAVPVTSSNGGQSGLPTNQCYDLYADVSQAWEWGSLGAAEGRDTRLLWALAHLLSELGRRTDSGYEMRQPAFLPLWGVRRLARPQVASGCSTRRTCAARTTRFWHRDAGQPAAAPGRAGPDLERWFRRDRPLLEPATRSGGPV